MGFDVLPIELRRLILAELDGFSSLASAILTCRALYSAYALKPSEAITRQILIKRVGLDVLPEVTIAFASSNLRPHAAEASDDFITTHLASRTVHPISANLAEYSRLEELDVCIRSLTHRFAEECFARLGNTIGPGESESSFRAVAPPSASELARIRRALYRFETFCNLYSRKFPSQAVSNESLNTFCVCFAPWENEQLGCILDFLFRITSPAFNDVAAHDVTWGNLRIEPALFISSISLQGVLSQGLNKIHAISTAESYDDRYAQLSSERLIARSDFLNRALRLTSRHDVESDTKLADFSLEDRLEYVRQPFFNDPDSGPNDAWEREHLNELSSGFVYQPHHHYLRELGYVMWDQARVDAILPFSFPQEVPNVIGTTQESSDTRWLSSWRKRAAIFNRGGRGWWDFEDESKIVWPKEQQQIERMGGKDDGTIPRSMGEAKRALLSMTLPSLSSTRASRQL